LIAYNDSNKLLLYQCSSAKMFGFGAIAGFGAFGAMDEFANLGREIGKNVELDVTMELDGGLSEPANRWQKYDTIEEMIAGETELKMINYDQLSDIKFLVKGGCGSVYSANYFNEQEGKSSRVALKSVFNLESNQHEFMDEVVHHTHVKDRNYILQIQGVTRDPTTLEYLMVMEFSNFGSLRDYLQKNHLNLTWKQRVNLLYNIAYGLREIHMVGLLHTDFHSGNLLLFGEKYDQNLAFQICDGARPDIGKYTPEFYKSLVRRCLDKDPAARPTAKDLVSEIYDWRFDNNKLAELEKAEVLNRKEKANNSKPVPNFLSAKQTTKQWIDYKSNQFELVVPDYITTQVGLEIPDEL
ncbi:8629_t:CDS:2, partial [Entrophospora sp. SA101]